MTNISPIVKIDEENCIITLQANGPLTKEWFDEVIDKMENFVKNHKLKWVIMKSDKFPSWESFSAFIEQLKAKSHLHKLVPYLAFVTDGKLWEFIDKVGKHLVHSKVKHFNLNEEEKAKEWILSDEAGIINHNFTVNKDLIKKEGILELKVVWKLTDEDYKKAIPQIDDILKNHKHIPILVDMSKFNGWNIKAWWDDFKFGLEHDFEFWKIAAFWINKKWTDYMLKISSWFIPWKIEEFKTRDEAIKWLKS